MMVNIQIKKAKTAQDLPLPKYQTTQSSGMDLYANIENPLTINPGESLLIPTGIHISIPLGYEAQIRPRSGLALKSSISIVNSPGTIDSDFRGEIGVILINHGGNHFTVRRGDRIAQMVVSKYFVVNWDLCEELDCTDRGDGCFGSTGVIENGEKN